MKVALYGQAQNEVTKKYAHILINNLEERGIGIWFEKKFYEDFKSDLDNKPYHTFDSNANLDNSLDYFFSVGGDGTFLRSVTFVKDLNIPIIGINTGRLGFLATIKKESISQAIDEIFKGDYILKERSLIEVHLSNQPQKLNELNFALNEVTITRKNTASMITVETELDEEHLTTYWSDGLIIATPTGSTGYSLSCGGPIISPKSGNLVLTPIAPHSLAVRPLVIPDTTDIQLKIDSRTHEVLLTLDSRVQTISSETKVGIKKCNFTIKTIHLQQQTFIETLREKLLWGEDKRN